ncbi:MAG: hypothetical protein U0K54_03620 [Acutalibacteraceae bacterium]|nr:hypothetical protein [Acutalibacteraceae bacterium]
MKKVELLQKMLKFFAACIFLAVLYYVISAIWNIVSVVIYYSAQNIDNSFWYDALKYIERSTPAATLAYRWSAIVYCVADMVSFIMVFKYLLDVIEEGTPFTPHSARHMTFIGLKTIFLPLIAELIALIIHLCYGVGSEYSDHMPVVISVIFGVVLLFVSLILHHVAELEEKLKNIENKE